MEPANKLSTLTARERDVLNLVIQGYSNDEIRFVLCCSISNVKFHISNIMLKLDAKSRTHAAYIAGCEGFIVGEPIS